MKIENLQECMKWLEYVAKNIGEDCSSIRFLGVADKPGGDDQFESNELFDELWIDQRGGPCGDDYYGEIYVRKGTMWIWFEFTC